MQIDSYIHGINGTANTRCDGSEQKQHTIYCLGGTDMIDDDAFDERTYALLAEFDSLGFVPTTLTPDPEKTAKEWKENLVAVITELYDRSNCLNKRVMELEQEVIHADEKVFYREINVKLSEDKIKAEAVKEFAEKLEKKVHNYYLSIDGYCCSCHFVLVKDIDELLKEYEKQ